MVAALGIVAAREARSASDTALNSTSPVPSAAKLFSDSYRIEFRRLSNLGTHRSLPKIDLSKQQAGSAGMAHSS